MKKLFASILSSTLILSILIIGVISSSATFGSGVTAVAQNVNLIKTGLLGQKLCFNDSDFKSALCISDFDTVTITEIPSSKEGTLLISGRRVGKDRVIKRKNLASLVFIPASGTVSEAKFKFKVDDGAEIECLMKFIDKVNYAPSIDESSVNASTVKTQESVSVFGKIEASDPEGDALQFITVIYPKHGTLEFVDESSGKYRYIPQDGYTGKDKFTYVIRDEYGNYTKAQTVNLKVTDRMCDAVYRDMTDREEYNAAVAMTAMGIMNGRLLGDDSYFLPDEKVSRAEFVTMAMKCAGIKADTTLTETFVEMGIDELSVSPSFVLEVRDTVRKIK